MATYRVTGPDGAVYEIDGPPGASREQVVAELQRQLEPQDDIFSRYKYQPDVIDQLEELVKGVPRGALGLLGTAATGAATLLPEEYETPTRDVIQSITELLQSPFAPDPGEEGLIGGTLGEGLGSTVPLLAASFFGPAGLAVAGATSVGAGAGTASERARAKGATEEERTQAALLGAPVGLAELLPIKFIRNMGETAAAGVLNRLGRAAETGGVEGLQEAATEVAQNLIAQNIYDPTEGAFTGTGEAFGVGVGVGALVQGLMDLVIPGKQRGAGAPQPAPVEPLAPVEPVEPAVEEAAAARRAERQSGVLEREMQRQRDALDALAEQRAFEATNRAANRQLGDEQGDLFPTDLIAALEQPAPRQDVTEEQAVALMAADAQRREMEEAAEAETIAQQESQIGIDEAIAADERAELQRLAAEEQTAEIARRDAAETREIEALIRADEQAAETQRIRDELERRQREQQVEEDWNLAEVNRAQEEVYGTEPASVAPMEAVIPELVASQEPDAPSLPPDPTNAAAMMALPKSQREEYLGSLSRPDRMRVSGEILALQREDRGKLPEIKKKLKTAAEAVKETSEKLRRGLSSFSKPGETTSETFGREMASALEPMRPKITDAIADLYQYDNNYRDRVESSQNKPLALAALLQPTGITASLDVPLNLAAELVQNGRDLGQKRLQARALALQPKPIAPEETSRERDGDGVQAEPTRTGRSDAAPAQRSVVPDRPVEPRPAREPAQTQDDGLAVDQPDDAVAGVRDAGVRGPLKAKAEPKKEEPKKAEAEPKKAKPKKAEPKPKVSRTAKERVSTKRAEPDADSAVVSNLIKSPKAAREEAAPKAARVYFNAEDGDVDAALRNMAYDDVNSLSQKAASEETNPAVKRKLEGKSGKTASDAIAWTRANLSKGANSKLDAFIKDAEKLKEMSSPKAMRAQQEARDAAILRQRQIKEALAKKPETEAGSGKTQAKLRKKQRDALLADEQFANDMLEVLEDSEVLGGIDDIGTLLYLESDGMLPFVAPVSPVAEGFLDAGDVKSALDAIAAQSADPVVKRITRKLAENIGDTKVEFVDSDTIDGRPAAYDPKTNTILLNRDATVTNHTLMHEAAHAVTQRTLRNKSHPLTRQVTSLFDRVKGRMEEMGEYGAKNVDEFVSEYFSNPLFRNELATIFDKQSDMSVLQRMAKSIGDFLKRIVGLPPRLTQEYIDDLMMGLMSPSMANRNVSEIYYAPETVGEYFNNNFRNQTEVSSTKDAMLDSAKEFASDGWKQTKKLTLGALPLPALVDLGKRYLPKSFNNFQDLTNRYAAAVQSINESLGNGSIKAVDDWTKSNPDKYGDLQRVIFDGTLAEIDFRKPRSEYSADPEKLKAYDALKSNWDNLGEGGQGTYRRIRATYDRLYKELIDQIKGDVTALGGSEQLGTALRNEFYKKLITEGGLEGYFPLTRQQGDYFLQYSYVDPTAGTQDVTQIFKTERERDRFASQLLAGDTTIVEGTLRTTDKIEKAMFNQYPTSSFLGGVMQILNANNADPQMIEQIMRMAIEVSPQNSLARMMQRRKGDLGFEENVLNVFRNSTLRLARRSAQIRFNSELGKLSRELDEEASPVVEAGGDSGKQAKLYRSELVERIKIARNPNIPWSVNLAKSITYGYTLGFNASSALIDMAAIPMVLYPTLKGKYRKGEVVKTINAATKLFMGSPSKHAVESYTTRDLDGPELQRVMKELGLNSRDVQDVKALKSLANYDFNSPDLPAELQKYKELVDVMREQGQIQRFSPLDDLESIGEGQVLAKVNAYQGFMMQASERFRREVTQASSYDLALKQMEEQGRTIDVAARREAALEAVRLSELINGSTSSLAGPRYAQTALGALPFMFKRYGISMMYLQYNQLRGILSKESDPEVRKQAYAQFGLTLGMSAIFAGARGMPLMGAVALLHNMFKDDEDDDFDTMMRMGLGTLGTEGIINHFAGINVSKRIALTDMMFRSDPGNEYNTPAELLWSELGGPTGGTIDRIYRGASQIGRGQIWRGIESLLPAAIANGMKAGRYATEGSRTTKGDVILDDIGPLGLMGQALGFSPAENARRQEFITLRKYADKKIQNRRSQLFDRAWMARKQGDFEAMQSVMEDIRKFNDSVTDPKLKILTKNLEKSAATRKSQDLKRIFGVVPGNYQQWRQKAIDVLGEDALD